VQVYRPKADFDANNFVSFCTPFEAKFTNTSTYFIDRAWDLGIATSRQENPSIYYTSKGNYTIKLKVTSPGGCQDEISKVLKVYNPEDATLSYNPTTGCNPLKVSFDAFTEMKASFIWDFGNGTVIDTTVNVIDHIYKDFGTFGPKLIFTAADDPNCKIPLTGATPITVLGAKAKFSINKTLFCDSGYLQISDSTTFNDPITNYTWNYGDGITSNNPHDTIHYYANPGHYDVFLTVRTSNNCIDTLRSKPIKIVQSPLIHIDSDSIICAKERMRHAGVFDRSDTSAVKWAWQFPNGNTAQIQYPARQEYDSSGYFIVKTVVTNSSGCTDSDSVRILVNPLPTIKMPSALTMQAGFPVTIPAVYAQNVISYSWLPDNNTLSCVNCPQPVTTNTKFNTKYSVAVVDSNGCKNSGEIQVIVICKNANVFAPNTFSPNGDGSNDIFYIRGKGIERIKSLRIFNRWGEVVFENKDFPVNNASSGWNGMYKGNKPQPDVYVYQVEVFCDNSEIIRFEGNVALIQ
jgi:gliding motility-associated-like protein